MTTLLDIKNLMTKYIDSVKPNSTKNGYEFYDSDGHCDLHLWNLNKKFWEGFDSDKEFIYLVSGKNLEDELDLDGGRDYFLIRSGIIPLLYKYMTETLKWSKDDYMKILYNSTELSDEIIYMYDKNGRDSIETKNERILWRTLKSGLGDVDSSDYSPLVIKYPESGRKEADECKNLKFIGNSRIDNSPLYMIMVPSGYTIVNSIDNSLK